MYPDKPKSNKAVVAKMLADQVLWAPFFSCVFFAVIKTLEVSLGASIDMTGLGAALLHCIFDITLCFDTSSKHATIAI